MSEFKMFSPSQLSKFKAFSQSLHGTVADPRRHQGAHDAKLRRRAHDEEVAPHVKSEMKREGRGPDPHSTKRLSRLVRELFGELAANRFETKVGERWPESLKDNEEREEDLHQARLEDDNDEDEDEDDEAQDETELEANEERRQQNKKSDMDFATEDDDDPNSQTLRATKGTPMVGGKFLPNNRQGSIPRHSGASDQARFNQRFPNAAAIESDPPRRPRKIAEDRKTKRKAFLAMDSKSRNSYNERFPGAAKIKAL